VISTSTGPSAPDHSAVNAGSILLISDDACVSLLIQRAVRSRGFGLRWEAHPQRGFKLAVQGGHRLVLVDAATTGLEVLRMVRQVRQQTGVPLIVISRPWQRACLVAALESGADDCLVGPSTCDEIVARIAAVLRRVRDQNAPTSEVLIVGPIRIAPASRLVQVDGDDIDLTSIEYDVLEYLTREAGRVVSRDELTAAVWRREASPLDRSLDVHISHLRHKLHRHGRQILTVRGIGYMLAAPAAIGSEQQI
jgi:two-component system response regulator CpxR